MVHMGTIEKHTFKLLQSSITWSRDILQIIDGDAVGSIRHSLVLQLEYTSSPWQFWWKYPFGAPQYHMANLHTQLWWQCDACFWLHTRTHSTRTLHTALNFEFWLRTIFALLVSCYHYSALLFPVWQTKKVHCYSSVATDNLEFASQKIVLVLIKNSKCA